jgi:predicted Zn-dependent protease
MTETTVSSLDPKLQQLVTNAQTALQRGNFDYVIETSSQILKAAPGCLAVRRLQRAAQIRQYQAKNKSITKSFGSVTQAGFLFSGAKKDPPKTMENAEKMLLADPTNVPALKLLSEAAAGLGLLETAAWAWECVHDVMPTDREALIKMGDGYLAANKPKDALRAADLMMKVRPQDPDALELMRRATAATAAAKAP